MGLGKEIEVNNTGVEGKYWNIHHIHIDKRHGMIFVDVAGYKDYQAREDGKEPLQMLSFMFKLTEYDGSNIFQWVYNKLCSTDEFKDAENILEDPNQIRVIEGG